MEVFRRVHLEIVLDESSMDPPKSCQCDVRAQCSRGSKVHVSNIPINSVYLTYLFVTCTLFFADVHQNKQSAESEK